MQNATFMGPKGLLWSSGRKELLVADFFNHRIRGIAYTNKTAATAISPSSSSSAADKAEEEEKEEEEEEEGGRPGLGGHQQQIESEPLFGNLETLVCPEGASAGDSMVVSTATGTYSLEALLAERF